MIVAGIDVGGKNLHIVIEKDGQILEKAAGPTGIKKAEAVEQLYDEVLKKAGITRKDVERVIATGSSAKRVAFASGSIPDAAADARGVNQLVPSARTVIDVGAEEPGKKRLRRTPWQRRISMLSRIRPGKRSYTGWSGCQILLATPALAGNYSVR